MSELPKTVMADVTTMPRWHRCEPCDVSWRGTEAVCWSCESAADVVPHYPPVGKDVFTSKVEGEPEGTPLTRFGSRAAG